jgi:DNA-directed RNA polymerase subunit F
MKIVSTKPVSISEVKEILEKRKEGESELGYEQQQTFEYAEKFARRSRKETASVAEKLMKANKKLTEEAAIKLADIAPKSMETIKAILLKDKIDLNEEELNDIYKQLQ